MKKKTPKGRFFALCACILWAWGAGLWWRWLTAAPNPNSNIIVRLEIPPSTPISPIITELEQQGIIRSGWFMRLWIKGHSFFNKNIHPLQAGTYDLAINQSLFMVMNQLQRGTPATNAITIPEGWNMQQMGEYYAASGYFPLEQFLAETNKETSTVWKKWLPSNVNTLEGFLFPDTYEIPLDGVTPKLVVSMMLDRFEEAALPRYQEHNKTNLTLLEWVSLSSIVEKEAVLQSERPTIAGVFWHRLKKNMRLESDPTVEYALKIRQTPENPLTLKQVRTPSPYNTYLNSGLPPGPIASPGLASLEATLDPPTTEFLFFVARYDGSHIFSRTLDEHENAIQKISEQFPSP